MDDLLDIGLTDDLLDTAWIEDAMADMPEIKVTPEDQAAADRFVAQAVARKKAKPKRQRKREDPDAGPSKKIAIRVLRSLLDLLKEQATANGMGYQTHANMLLYDAALR